MHISNDFFRSCGLATDDKEIGKSRQGNARYRRPWTLPLSSLAHLVVGDGGGMEVPGA